MSLNVKTTIAVAKDCKSIVLTDITGDGSGVDGYGGENTPLSAISKVRIIVYTQNNDWFELSRGPLDADRKWVINASDFTEGQPIADTHAGCDDCCGQFMGNVFFSTFLPYGYFSLPCEDPIVRRFPNKFEDMCYKIIYEVYSKTHVPATTATYSFIIPYCIDRYVFVRVNGAWYDVTDQMVEGDGDWTFTKENTSFRYDKYEVRDQADNVYSQGRSNRIGTCRRGWIHRDSRPHDGLGNDLANPVFVRATKPPFASHVQDTHGAGVSDKQCGRGRGYSPMVACVCQAERADNGSRVWLRPSHEHLGADTRDDGVYFWRRTKIRGL